MLMLKTTSSGMRLRRSYRFILLATDRSAGWYQLKMVTEYSVPLSRHQHESPCIQSCILALPLWYVVLCQPFPWTEPDSMPFAMRLPIKQNKAWRTMTVRRTESGTRTLRVSSGFKSTVNALPSPKISGGPQHACPHTTLWGFR
jgi:hypothetical protein